jgi:hypothetical protein
MNLKSTQERITKTLNDVVNSVDQVAIPYLKELEGSTKQRIHNKGRDSDHQQIGIKNKRAGRYSPGYEKRKKKGGKINGTQYAGSGEDIYPINLQLHGDLLRSFTVGTAQGKPVLRFQDDFNSNKAAWNERNFKTEIYKPSEDQLDAAKEILLSELKSIFNTLF